MSLKRLFTAGLSVGLFIFICGAVVLLQHKIDGYAPPKDVPYYSLSLSGHFQRLISLEYKEVVADALWIQAIQLMDQKLPDAKETDLDDRLYNLLDRATDLDSRDLLVYQMGGVALSVLLHRGDLSNALLKKGFKEIPNHWELPFYIGFNYMYHLQDNLKAAQYMGKASKIEGHPPYLPLLTSRLYSQGDDPQTAILFLKGVYLSTKDEKMREKIGERILDIEKALNSQK